MVVARDDFERRVIESLREARQYLAHHPQRGSVTIHWRGGETWAQLQIDVASSSRITATK